MMCLSKLQTPTFHNIYHNYSTSKAKVWVKTIINDANKIYCTVQ
jgi:hypothetical protein